jgi:hypothetical protein
MKKEKHAHLAHAAFNMKIRELIKPNDFDKKAKGELKLLDVNAKANLFIGDKKEVTAQTVVVRNSKTGEVVGRRTIYQK